MWALLNQTRGQIGLTAYKDYIFGLLFYKYLSEKATQWLGEVLRGDTWEN
ncbi:type I restriction-modification system subunit M N-terminal domain-containing protein, partial [Lactococcus lactis]